MSLEEHYGFDPGVVPATFGVASLRLVKTSAFQLGCNNLFVFQRRRPCPNRAGNNSCRMSVALVVVQTRGDARGLRPGPVGFGTGAAPADPQCHRRKGSQRGGAFVEGQLTATVPRVALRRRPPSTRMRW